MVTPGMYLGAALRRRRFNAVALPCRPDPLLALVEGPHDLEDVMLTDETLVAPVEDLEHHFVHVGQLVHVPVDGYRLQTEEGVVNQFQVGVVLDVVHGFVAGLEYGDHALADGLAVALGDVSLDVLFGQA